MNFRYSIFLLLLFSPCINVKAAELQWQLAPATASARPDDTADARFVSIDSIKNGDGFLVSEDGWFWLKSNFVRTASPQALLIGGASLYWSAWIDGDFVAESGSPPPWWYASSPFPEMVNINRSNGTTGTLLIKVYYRRGFSEWNGPLEIGDVDQIRNRRILFSLRDILLPFLTIVFGLILIILALSLYSRKKLASDFALAGFSGFLILTRLPAILSLFPSLSAYFSWMYPVGIAAVATPLVLSSWRRSIMSVGGKRESLVISLIDKVLALAVAVWMLVPMLPRFGTKGILYQLSNVNLLTYYSAAVGFSVLLVLFVKIIRRQSGVPRVLIPLLAALTPAVIGAVSGEMLVSTVSLTLEFGLPLYLLFAIPALMISGGPVEAGTEKPAAFEEPEELEELEPLDAEPLLTQGVQKNTDRDERLARNLRLSLYPDSIPWDPDWDLASAHRGPGAPATGFHDYYLDSNGRIAGFSFMDVADDKLESTIFMHLVKSEIREHFDGTTALSRILRTVHRRTLSAAQSAGKSAAGIVGRLTQSRVSYLAMAAPPMLLWRQRDNKTVLLRSKSGENNNAAIGSRGFTENVLHTMGLTMEQGDVLLAYDNALPSITNSNGERWGMGRLAGSLRNSNAHSAAEILGKLVDNLKDFLESNTINQAVNIFVIRRR